jgi:uncharacterized protein (DUF2267 family)
MPAATSHNFNHAMHTANIWLADVGASLGTADRRYSYRALRAWLHALRDRLTVDAAVKFGAQLPELLRGIYYDGWTPAKAPIRYGFHQYTQRFALEAAMSPDEVPSVAAAVTQVVAAHVSPGQLEQALAELPSDLRNPLLGNQTRTGSSAEPAPGPGSGRGAAHHRVVALEERVASLTEAVHALAQGLRDAHLTGIESAHIASAARVADEILLASELESRTAGSA